MASSFADYLENKLIAHHFGGASFTATSTLRIGLSTTTPTDAGGNITEPADGYSRVTMINNNSVTGWTVPAIDGTFYFVHNRGTLTFPEATSDWGTVTYFVVYDDSSNVMGYAQLDVSKTIASGDTAEFPSGNLIVKLY